MIIYLLIKESYYFEGATEAQDITAYYNKEDALKIKNAYDAYREQSKALPKNPEFDKWDDVHVEAVEVK